MGGPLLSKFRAFMTSPLLTLVCAVLLALHGAGVRAEKADRNKPMNIEADVLRYDDVRQISVFSGRVLLTKGSIQIRGDQVEVRQDPEGFQFGTVTGNPAKPAFFRQKREGVDEYIEGEAEVLSYDGRADTVTLTRKAQLRRFRGSVLADEITGGVIVYNSLTDMFTVDGASSGRVRATLAPRPEGGPAK